MTIRTLERLLCVCKVGQECQLTLQTKEVLTKYCPGCGVLRCCTGGRRSTLLGNYLFIHYRCLPESLLSETIAAKLNSFMIIMSLKFVDMDCNENVVALCDQKMIFLVTVSSRLVAAN